MAKVAIVMGSTSDWPTMQNAALMLKQFGVEFEAQVVSAHRTPNLLVEFAETAEEKGFCAIIAGAGGAAHLPGMIAAHTHLPASGIGLQGVPSQRRIAVRLLHFVAFRCCVLTPARAVAPLHNPAQARERHHKPACHEGLCSIKIRT